MKLYGTEEETHTAIGVLEHHLNKPMTFNWSVFVVHTWDTGGEPGLL